MRVVVFGAGAIGSLLGAMLFRAGHTVLLVGRPDHVAAVRANGLQVSGQIEETVRVGAATAVPAGFDAEAVLLTTKTFDLPAAAGLLALEVPTPAATLLPQNGLGAEEVARIALHAGGWTGVDRVLVRVVNSIPATLLGPGAVRAAGVGEMLFGPSRGVAAAATRTLSHLLRGAGVPTRTVSDLERELWRKALVNAAVNPITALHGIVNGRLQDEPYSFQADELLLEALTAARAYGFDFSEKEVRADLAKVVRASAENRSSMLQDVERRRPTEVQAISGELLRRAEAKGIDLPATRRAIDAIRLRTSGHPRRSAKSS